MIIHPQTRKPRVKQEIIDHFGIENDELDQVCVVGDRVLTDVLQGTLHGMPTILVEPFTSQGENFVVKAVRKIEGQNGIIHWLIPK